MSSGPQVEYKPQSASEVSWSDLSERVCLSERFNKVKSLIFENVDNWCP